MPLTRRGMGVSIGVASTAVLWVWCCVLLAHPADANQVRYQAVVDGTINGEVVRNAVFKCEGSDGTEVLDTESIKLTLENGAVMDVNVRCKPPVYVYEREYAGSIPGRVVPMTAPLCDTPLNPITVIEETVPPARRRLVRMTAAGMHTAAVGNMEDTVFSHFTNEEWGHYKHGTRSLAELGIHGNAAMELQVNTTLLYYLHQRMSEIPAVLANFRGMDTLLGTDNFYFPPFMRDSEGNVMDVEYQRVFNGFMGIQHEQATNSTSVVGTPQTRRRRLFFGAALGAAALGVASYAVGVIKNEILPKLDAIDEAMELQAVANEGMRGMISANAAFAQESRNMAEANLNATKAMGLVQDVLVKKTSANADAILGNTELLLAQATASDAGFADAAAERQNMLAKMLQFQQETQSLGQSVTGDLKSLQDYVVDGFGQVNSVLDDAMADRVDDLRSVRRDIQAVTMQLRQTNILMYRHRINAKLRRNLALLFYEMHMEAVTTGMRAFLWDASSGEHVDIVRGGETPDPAKWTPGNPQRRVEVDTISVMYGENGFHSPGVNQNTLHQLDLTIVCDGEALLNEITPWFTWRDISQMMGPDKCVPLPTGYLAFPSMDAQPDADAGQWITEMNGSPKIRAGSDQPLIACKCWIEFQASSCKDNPRPTSESPFERVGIDTSTAFGPGGLAAAPVCELGQSDGATGVAPWSNGMYDILATMGVNTYQAFELRGQDQMLDWFDPSIRYISTWDSVVALLEQSCGHEKFFSVFTGNPMFDGFKRAKYFGDGAAYALITSSTLSSVFEPGADVASFVLKIASDATSEQCDAQNAVDSICKEGQGRATCESCQRCSATDMSVSRYNQDPTRPPTLAAMFFLTLENAWKSVVPALREMEVSRYGTLPSDVWTWKQPFQNDPNTRSSFECTYASWIYTTPQYIPIHKLKPTQIAMQAQVTMDPWGNNGSQLDPSTYIKVPGTSDIALPSRWVQTTSDPELENRFSFILPPDMLLPGKKECMWNECQRPEIFFNAESRLMDTTNIHERYTFDIPQDMISTSPDAAGRANRVSYIHTSKTQTEIQNTGFSLNEWIPENQGAQFRAEDASASLHWYYSPLVKSGNDVQCAGAGGTHTGGWCNTLQKYRVYMPSGNDYDDEGLQNKCTSDNYLCLIPKVWKYEWQASLKKGEIIQGVESGCPTLDTSAITDAQVPTLYLYHSQPSAIRTRITMDGENCTLFVDEYDVPANKRVGLDVEVCGGMTIRAEQWVDGGWATCVDSVEEVDVQDKPVIQIDSNTTVTVVRETTVIQSTDNEVVNDLAQSQNKMLEDAVLAISVLSQLLPDANRIQLQQLTPSVYNYTAMEAITTSTHALLNQSITTEDENQSERWNIIQDIVVHKDEFNATTIQLDQELNDTLAVRDAAIAAAEAQLVVLDEKLADLLNASAIADNALANASAALRHAAALEVEITDIWGALDASLGNPFDGFSLAGILGLLGGLGLAACMGPMLIVILLVVCCGPKVANWCLDFLDRAGQSEGAMNVLTAVVPTGRIANAADAITAGASLLAPPKASAIV